MFVLAYIWGFFLGAFIGVWTLFCAFLLCFLAYLIPNRKFHDWYVREFWAGVILKLSGITIHIDGMENLTKDSGGLYAFNHSSNFDIFLMFNQLPSVRFGAKAELFKVPFLSRAMHAIGILPIERKNKKKVFEVYAKASQRMASGEYFALAPEGTRTHVDGIAEFKNGPFVFAANAKADVFPVVIYGAEKLMKPRRPFVNPGRFGNEVWMRVLPPISTSNVLDGDISEVRDLTRQKMIQAYEELRVKAFL